MSAGDQCVLIIGNEHLLLPQDEAYDLFKRLRKATPLDSHYGSGYTVNSTPLCLRLASISAAELAKLLLAE